MIEDKRNKRNAAPLTRAQRIRDAFPMDDEEQTENVTSQNTYAQSGRTAEDVTFDGSDFFAELPFVSATQKVQPSSLAIDPENEDEHPFTSITPPLTDSPTEEETDTKMPIVEPLNEEVADTEDDSYEAVEVAKEPPKPKPQKNVKKAKTKKRTEKIITVRPRAHRDAPKQKNQIPFKEHPFVRNTIAFAREYKKELPHNYLLFTPFLPLGICVLLVLFRILYAVAAPSTGANIYACVAIINVISFLPLCTFYLRQRPILSDRMGWQFPSVDKIPLILVASIALFFGAAALTSLGAYFGITDFRYHLFTFYDIPATTSIAGILFSTVTLALIPALTEEILCRGIIFAEYQYDNTPLALIMSAIFSAVLQFDPSRVFVGLFCGFLLGTVRMVTNSLSASIAVHMIYNVACLFYEHFFGIMGNQLSEFLILFFLCAVLALISFFFLFSTAEKVCRTYEEEQKEITVDLRSSSGVALKSSLRVAFISPTLYFVLIFYLVASFFI